MEGRLYYPRAPYSFITEANINLLAYINLHSKLHKVMKFVNSIAWI